MRPATLALLIALLASPAAAQDLDAAKAFVTGLYAAYATPPVPDYLGRQAKDTFSPALLDLMRRDAARTPKGEVGTLDGDPICNCQDQEIGGVSVVVTAAGASRATAIVGFRNFGAATNRSYSIPLIPANAGTQMGWLGGGSQERRGSPSHPPVLGSGSRHSPG